MKKILLILLCAILNYGCGASDHCFESGGYYNDITHSCVCPAYSAIGRCLSLGGRTPEILFADGSIGEINIAGRANSYLSYHNEKLSFDSQDYDAGHLIRNQETQLVIVFPRISRASNMTLTFGECVATFSEGNIDTIPKHVVIELEVRAINVVAHCNEEFETHYKFDGYLGISGLRIKPRP